MNCEILNTLYLKSNGEILCNDDFGEQIVLGLVDEEQGNWDIAEIFNNEKYIHIRESFLNNKVPWEGVCQNCAFLRTNENYSDDLSRKVITKFQLEPSLACNLACPCCTNYNQIRTREKPHIMPELLFSTVLRSLKVNNYSLNFIEYCGQGDPLMHPRFSSISKVAREFYPDTPQRLITNGNFDYQSKLENLFLDEIYVSCDGVRQGSYEKYRRKGEVGKVLKFIRDIPSQIEGKKQNLIWKYILFEFNDSDEELIEAQHLAQELGVDTLLFVVTHSDFRSQKYTLESLGELPILFSNVKTNAHPSFYNGVVKAERKNGLVTFKNRFFKSSMAHIDEISILPGNILSMRGWVASKAELTHVEVYLSGTKIGRTIPTEMREDVVRSLPNFKKQPGGFLFTCKLEYIPDKKAPIKFELYNQDQSLGTIEQNYLFG